MESRRGILWYFVNGGMELSWLSAWVVFLTAVTLGRSYPVVDGVATFILAAVLTRLATGRGWRIAVVLGLQLAGFAAAATLTIQQVYGFPWSPLDTGWLAALSARLKEPSDWLNFYLQILLVIVIWSAGRRLARRPGGYLTACNRFDGGIAAFFVLFFVRLMIQLRSEARVEDPNWQATLLAFFAFGLLALGLGRLRGSAARSFLPGYRGLGVVAGFATVVLLGAGGLLLFFLPVLTAAAQIGQQVLETAGSPLLQAFLVVIRWLYAPRSILSDPPMEKQDPLSDLSNIKPAQHDGWLGILERVVAWGVGGLFVLLLVAMALLVVVVFVKWLLRRTARQPDLGQSGSFAAWLAGFQALLRDLWLAACRALRGRRTGPELYRGMLGWARRSGVARLRSETPTEFAARLGDRFPSLSPHFVCLVGALHREAYAERPLNAAELAEARAAWRTLRGPVHWPARLRGWFISPSEDKYHR